MRCVPGDRVKRLAIWFPSRCAAFLPSIQISMLFRPSGELPLARSSKGEAAVAVLGTQILAAKFAEPGGEQFTYPLAAMRTSMFPPHELERTKSLRPSRLRS